MNTMISTHIGAVVSVLSFALPAGAATHYVDSSCTYDGDGTAESCAASAGSTGAWNMIGSKESSTSAGDLILLKGTFSKVDWNGGGSGGNGERGSPITFTSLDPNAPATFESDTDSVSAFFVDASHILIDGLRFEGENSLTSPRNACLTIKGADDSQANERDIRVTNSRFIDCGTAVAVTNVIGFEIEKNSASGQSKHCVYLAGEAEGFRIREMRCLAYKVDNAGACFHLNTSDAIKMGFIRNSGCMNFNRGVELSGTISDVDVSNNAFSAWEHDGNDPCDDSTGCYIGGVSCTSATLTNFMFSNNVVSGQFQNMGYAATSPTCIGLKSDYNSYFDSNGGLRFLEGSSTMCYESTDSAPPWGNGSNCDAYDEHSHVLEADANWLVIPSAEGLF